MFNIIPTPQIIKDTGKTASFNGAQILNNLENMPAINIEKGDDFKINITVNPKCEKFENKGKSEGYVIDIKEDEKLVKVEFEIRNTTSNNIKVKVDSTKTSIKLATKDDTYIPLITAIENDFMFYNKIIKGNSVKKAVLLFGVPKTVDVDRLSLEIQGVDSSTSISINT